MSAKPHSPFLFFVVLSKRLVDDPDDGLAAGFVVDPDQHGDHVEAFGDHAAVSSNFHLGYGIAVNVVVGGVLEKRRKSQLPNKLNSKRYLMLLFVPIGSIQIPRSSTFTFFQSAPTFSSRSVRTDSGTNVSE